MGLGRILVYSILGGVSLALTFQSGSKHMFGYGFVLEQILPNSDPTLEGLLLVVSAATTIYFVTRLSKFLVYIIEKRLVGISIAVLGYLGSFLIISSNQTNYHLMIGGAGLWLVALVIVVSYRHDTKAR